LSKLGIYTMRDLLYYMPRDYELTGQRVSIRDLKPDGAYSITALIKGNPNLRRVRNGVTLTTFSFSDETGNVEAVFFNQPYLKRMYKNGDKVFVSGKTKIVGRKLQFTNPSIEKGNGGNEGLLAVYPLTGGLSQKVMRILMKSALSVSKRSIIDIFPNDFRAKYTLAEVNYCVSNIHLPADDDTLAIAKHRLIFEELLLFNIALLLRESSGKNNAPKLISDSAIQNEFLSMLSFKLTNAQHKVMSEIAGDISKARPMNRLMQGDVGSGKTTPAFYAMYICAKNKMQSVMMAPTEVLAKQHYKNAIETFANTSINIEIITGSTTAAARKHILANIAGGLTDIVIGTHAVLYDKVQFATLGLIITDEQHRFGVNQRAMLKSKSTSPHTLIMSATPIPRSLALILYGKTDISIIDEMPPGRLPVKTFIVGENKRSDMYDFLQKEIDSGSQIFVVCPLVEQSDSLDVRSSQEVFEELCKCLGEKNVALLHGRMKPTEKNTIMDKFKNHDFSVLVSTTVIEVGVDVPNATIMIIENAERFGLAQLHQLRGRVGRGAKRAYCFLMCERTDIERLDILTKTNDGFKISEEDLRLRGPGQFLGSKQSGISDLYMANLIKDMKLLKTTRTIAYVMANDNAPLYTKLKQIAEKRFAFEKITIN
ncbi:MAG: ATP-dependent DNA helicase RecG, partial [Clostridia bacterium]|nr:ATP-dependent DNA helicase RecG [Clostridia bacterium]